MSREPVDPRIDTMMAALYGELSDGEDRAFRRLLETDEDLRREWEELTEGREILAGWRIPERVPTFLLPERRAAVPWWSRWTEGLRGGWSAPAVGLSLATIAALSFFFGQRSMTRDVDARIEQVVAREVEEAKATLAASLPATDAGPILGDGRELALGARPESDSGVITPATVDRYLTRNEFQSENAQLLTSLADVLNRHEARRESEVAHLVESLYARVSDQQLYDYRALKSRIDALGMDLALERRRVDEGFSDFLQADGSPSPEDRTSGEGKE